MTSSTVSGRDVAAGLCACLSYSLSLTLIISQNALFTDWLNTFQSNRGTTTAVQATCIGVTLGGGLLAGVFEQRLGARVSVLTGSVLSCLGLLCGGFAASLPTLILCVGVVAGSGFCLLHLSSLSVAMRRFPHRAGFVSSVMATVTSLFHLGTPLLYRYLSEQYTWRGCLILTSGIALHSAVTGLLLTSPLLSPPRPATTASLVLLPPQDALDGAVVTCVDHAIHDAKSVCKRLSGERLWSVVHDDGARSAEIEGNTVHGVASTIHDDGGNSVHGVVSTIHDDGGNTVHGVVSTIHDDGGTTVHDVVNTIRHDDGGKTTMDYDGNTVHDDRETVPRTEAVRDVNLGDYSMLPCYHHQKCPHQPSDNESETQGGGGGESVNGGTIPETDVDADDNLSDHLTSLISHHQDIHHKPGENTLKMEGVDGGCGGGGGVVDGGENLTDNTTDGDAGGRLDDADECASRARVRGGVRCAAPFLTSPAYLAVLLCQGLTLSTTLCFVILVLDFADAQGWSVEDGVLLNLVFMLSTVSGRALLGLVSLHRRADSQVLMVVSAVLGSGGMCVLGQVRSLAAACVCYACMGAGYGGVIGMLPPAVLQVTGAATYPLALGLVCTVEGVMDALVGIATGFLVDWLQSYSVISLAYGVVSLLSGLLLLLVSACHTRGT